MQWAASTRGIQTRSCAIRLRAERILLNPLKHQFLLFKFRRTFGLRG